MNLGIRLKKYDLPPNGISKIQLEAGTRSPHPDPDPDPIGSQSTRYRLTFPIDRQFSDV